MKIDIKEGKRMENITVKQAYSAMHLFLQAQYDMTEGTIDVGDVLGNCSLLGDGSTADPAMWYDWLTAVEKAKDNPNDELAKLKFL